MKIGVVELKNEYELGKHAIAQIREMDAEADHRVVNNLIDLPGEASRVEADALLVLADITREDYVEPVVKALIDLEIRLGKPVEKLLEEKTGDRHSFERGITELAREKAEKIVTKLDEETV